MAPFKELSYRSRYPTSYPFILASISIFKVSAIPHNQVLNIKGMNGNERYKMTLTDGETTIIATTATQLSGMVTNGEIRVFSVVKLVEHVVNVLAGKP